MLAFALIVQVLLAAAVSLLVIRTASARAAASHALAAGGPFAAPLREAVRHHGDDTLWPTLGAGGIRELTVRHRELHDGYRTLDELLATLAAADLHSDRATLERTIKATYQLAATLDLDDRSQDRLLDAPLQALEVLLAATGPHALERIPRGARVDRATMFPLTEGTRVVQPIGVIVRDGDGRVVERAKVFCG